MALSTTNGETCADLVGERRSQYLSDLYRGMLRQSMAYQTRSYLASQILHLI